MEQPIHSMKSLFDQLGLDSRDQSIEEFLQAHRPLAAHVPLHEAPFWKVSQATTLRQLKEEDADWAIVVDELDAMLRHGETDAGTEPYLYAMR